MRYCEWRQEPSSSGSIFRPTHSGRRDHLPSSTGRIQFRANQSVKYSHGGASGQRSAARRPGTDVADEFFAAQDDKAAIQVEERETHAGDMFGRITARTQQAFNLVLPPMLSMANVFVERGHRPAGNRQYQATAII